MKPQLTDEQAKFIADAREMLNWLEAHPRFIATWYPFTSLISTTPEELKEFAKAAGKVEKKGDEMWMNLYLRFGSHYINAYTSRTEVCTKVQTGTKKVMKIDPTWAPPKVVAPMIEVEEPVYEWDCGSILAPKEEVAAR